MNIVFWIVNIKRKVSNMVNTLEGYRRCQIAKAEGKPLKDLDWGKLTRYVEQHKSEIVCVGACLLEDYEWTYDEVYTREEGWIEDNWAYTTSLWATPIAYIHTDNDVIEFTESIEVKEVE
jgi:hypothetical protein